MTSASQDESAAEAHDHAHTGCEASAEAKQAAARDDAARSSGLRLDPHEDRAWQSFFGMQVLFWRKMAQQLHQDTGLSEPDLAILGALNDAPQGRLRPFQLGSVTDFEKSRLHHQLDRMMRRGLITREPCADDPRGTTVVLTAQGREAILQAIPRRAAHIRQWLIEPLDHAQLDVLTEVCDLVAEGLRTGRKTPPGSDQAECER
ncbi:hypothetical protein GCM10023205_53670 [Yinghuangia aomiensis]|uniref:HTH marR-type domain-containing protein n=1 Tax=Yinghuangia aomiensis TaxID=676205 RepID=A0ABP9HU34_9ACTN